VGALLPKFACNACKKRKGIVGNSQDGAVEVVKLSWSLCTAEGIIGDFLTQARQATCKIMGEIDRVFAGDWL